MAASRRGFLKGLLGAVGGAAATATAGVARTIEQAPLLELEALVGDVPPSNLGAQLELEERQSEWLPPEGVRYRTCFIPGGGAYGVPAGLQPGARLPVGVSLGGSEELLDVELVHVPDRDDEVPQVIDPSTFRLREGRDRLYERGFELQNIGKEPLPAPLQVRYAIRTRSPRPAEWSDDAGDWV